MDLINFWLINFNMPGTNLKTEKAREIEFALDGWGKHTFKRAQK